MSSLSLLSRESDACSVLHIGSAGRSANGVLEMSVLHPRGPVLRTQVATFALIVYVLT